MGVCRMELIFGLVTAALLLVTMILPVFIIIIVYITMVVSLSRQVSKAITTKPYVK